MNFWENLVTNILLIGLSFLFIWYKFDLKIRLSDKYKIELKKREAFKSVLLAHSHLLYKDNKDEWLDEFSDSTINLLLWCSDEILYEYVLYARDRLKDASEILNREIHFANSILIFRSELGYKNKCNSILPSDIVKIFRIGFKNHL